MKNGCANTINRKTVITMTVLLTCYLLSGTSFGKELAKGRYQSASGNKIVVELEIADPPPPLVIVIQQLPQGTQVTGSTPDLMKYDSGKGMAKWLLRGTSSGKSLITMQLDRSMKKGEVSGEIRYRDNNGNMVNRKISSD